MPSFEKGQFTVKLSTSNIDWNWHASMSWAMKNKLSNSIKECQITTRIYYCQGAFVCLCGKVLRAPTAGKRDRNKWLADKACSKCHGFEKNDIKCAVKLYKRECANGGYILIEQTGKHAHGFPDLEKAAPSDKVRRAKIRFCSSLIGQHAYIVNPIAGRLLIQMSLKNIVLQNPAVKPKTLTTGAIVNGDSKRMTKLTELPQEISEAFLNAGNLAYLRRKWLSGEGINPDTGGVDDVTVLKFLQYQDEPDSTFGDFIRIADLKSTRFRIVLMTRWMERMFVEREPGAAEAGKNGILTDVTYSFFKAFYLCTSSIYNSTLGRWIPIIWTLLHRQKIENFRDHFYYLIEVLYASNPNATLDDFDSLLSGVVDFSEAQKKGLQQAYISFFSTKFGGNDVKATTGNFFLSKL